MEAERFLHLAQQTVDQRWAVYEEMAHPWRESFSQPIPAGSRDMDLSTRHLGLTLRNPLVASPSPMSQTVDGVRRMADGGVGAVVLESLFEEHGSSLVG